MRIDNPTTVRISGETVARVKALLPLLGRNASVNSFVEDAVEAVLEMIETKVGERKTPALVRRVDAASTSFERLQEPAAQDAQILNAAKKPDQQGKDR